MSAYQDLIKLAGNAPPNATERTEDSSGQMEGGATDTVWIPHTRSAAYSIDVTRIAAMGGGQRRGRWISEQLEPRPLSRAESRTTFSSPSADVIPCQDRGAPPPPSPKRLNMLISFALASSLDNYTRLHQEETLTHRRGSRHPPISRRQQETLRRGSDKQWGLMCTSATCTPVRKSRITIFL